MPAMIVIAVSDLMFQSRIEIAARSTGADVTIADTPDRLDASFALAPAVLVVDVHETAFDANDAIARATAAGTRVLGFGRHTSPDDLRAARTAGAELVVPRSDLVEKLPELLERLLPVSEIDRT